MTDTNIMDQAAIDEILASAEADTPESRIERLEKEVNILKGSVKKLLLDLRETLNNIENPFQNLQNLTEGALGSTAKQPPQIQVIPTQIPESKEPETEPEKGAEGGKEEKKEERKEVAEEAEENVVVEEVENKASLEMKDGKAEGDIVQDYSLQVRTEPSGQSEPKSEYKTTESEYKATHSTSIAEIKKYDIITLFNLMEWVKSMLEKYSLESLKLMLELFESAGYISEDARNFVCKIAELVSLNNGFEDMLFELYRLHKLMNPADRSMDSKLLSLILEKRL